MKNKNAENGSVTVVVDDVFASGQVSRKFRTVEEAVIQFIGNPPPSSEKKIEDAPVPLEVPTPGLLGSPSVADEVRQR